MEDLHGGWHYLTYISRSHSTVAWCMAYRQTRKAAESVSLKAPSGFRAKDALDRLAVRVDRIWPGIRCRG